MRLFISYSRDDRAWVYELWRALRDRAHHDAWIDQRIIPATDWWESILQNIETCETFVYIMTPKCVESIYCGAELAYALALNKPILPLMLKPCDVPSEVKRRRIQYFTVTEKESLGDVLFTCSQGLGEIRIGLMQGKYPPTNPAPQRSDEPTPAKKPEQVSEVFMLAEEAAAQNNFTLSEKLFQQVIDTDPQAYGLAAAERLSEIRHERGRNADYLNIVQMAGQAALMKGAKALWRVYVSKYGTEYDPNGLMAALRDVTPPPPAPPHTEDAAGRVPTQTPPVQTPHNTDAAGRVPTPPHKPRSMDLMPAPFAWIDIAAGKVTLEKGGYLDKDTAFDVSAFAIAKYPTTNAQFAEFVKAGGYREKRWWTDAGWEAREQGIAYVNSKWQATGKAWTEPRYWTDKKWNALEQPVVGVSWYESVAFCLWLSELTGEKIVLPSEQQWQRAAQGDKGYVYPWGNEWDGSRCNNSVKSFDSKQTTPVTQYEGKGNSPYEVVDMAGNVWEWCATSYVDGNQEINSNVEYRTLRGGSWYYSGTVIFRAGYRYRLNPHNWFNLRGFRCALLSL